MDDLELYAEMTREYAKAERYWVLSAMTHSEVVESRRNFVMMYEPLLRKIYDKAKARADKGTLNRQAFIEKTDADGITELLKDYKSFKDPGSNSMEFLHQGDPELPILRESVAAEYRSVEARKSAGDDIRSKASEFHRWMMRNCDKSGGKGAEFRGAGGSVRAFAENFMKQDPKDQLKAMYILENGLRHQKNVDLSDNVINAYRPDINKLKSQMVSTRWKFWQRISSSNIYWQKLKECMDKVQYEKTTERDGITAEEITGGTANALMHGANTFDAANTVAGLTGNELPASGITSTALWGAKNVVASVTGIVNAVKNSETMTIGQKLETASDVTVSGGNAILANTKYAIEKIPGVSKAALGTGVSLVGAGAMGYWTLKSGIQAGVSAHRASAHKGIVKEANRLAEQGRTPEEKAELEKLVENSRVIHTINKEKVKSQLVDCGFNSVFLAASITGIAASATVATVFSGASIVVVPASIAAANKMKAVETKKVIDTKLYKNADEKQGKIDHAKFLIGSKFSMLNRKIRTKYKKLMAAHLNNDSSILNSLRKKAVGDSGLVNNAALRNQIISGIGNDAYDRLHGNFVKEKEGNVTEFDRKMDQLTRKMIASAGGKVNRKQIVKPNGEGREKAVQSMLTGV